MTHKQVKLTDSLGVVDVSCWFLSVELTAGGRVRDTVSHRHASMPTQSIA